MTGGSHNHQINIWALPGGLSAPPRLTVRDTQLLTLATGGSKCGGDGDGHSPALATHHGRGKRLGSTRNSPRIHSRGRFEWRMTGEADRRWSKLQTPPMVSGGGGSDSGRKKPV